MCLYVMEVFSDSPEYLCPLASTHTRGVFFILWFNPCQLTITYSFHLWISAFDIGVDTQKCWNKFQGFGSWSWLWKATFCEKKALA
ncbi:hypothetical protein Hdeb2414_s0330g00869431 [Helianthus debilis subsp. tardiflorus]